MFCIPQSKIRACTYGSRLSESRIQMFSILTKWFSSGVENLGSTARRGDTIRSRLRRAEDDRARTTAAAASTSTTGGSNTSGIDHPCVRDQGHHTWSEEAGQEHVQDGQELVCPASLLRRATQPGRRGGRLQGGRASVVQQHAGVCVTGYRQVCFLKVNHSWYHHLSHHFCTSSDG